MGQRRWDQLRDLVSESTRPAEPRGAVCAPPYEKSIGFFHGSVEPRCWLEERRETLSRSLVFYFSGTVNTHNSILPSSCTTTFVVYDGTTTSIYYTSSILLSTTGTRPENWRGASPPCTKKTRQCGAFTKSLLFLPNAFRSSPRIGRREYRACVNTAKLFCNFGLKQSQMIHVSSALKLEG